MENIGISPIYWSTETLAQQGKDVIHELALRCVGTDTAYRYLLGRCLLAGKTTELFQENGCSGAIHYAVVKLGITERSAGDFQRVAAALETLPILRRAAEGGEIAWSKLREVVRKADVFSERYWLHLCQNRTYAEIQKLVSYTEKGGLPDPSLIGGQIKSGKKTELRYTLSDEAMEVVSRGMEALAEREGRRLSMEQATLLLFSQVLDQRASDPRRQEKVLDGARKDLQAGRERMERLVTTARGEARNFGFSVSDPFGLEIWQAASQELQDQPRTICGETASLFGAVDRNLGASDPLTSVLQADDDEFPQSNARPVQNNEGESAENSADSRPAHTAGKRCFMGVASGPIGEIAS